MSVDDPHNLGEQLSSQRDKLNDLNERDADMLWDFAAVASKEMAESTIVQYLSKLRNISQATDEPIEEMSPRQLDAALDDMEDDRGWTSGTRRNYEKALRVLFRELGGAHREEFRRDYGEILPSPAAIRLSDKSDEKITAEDVLSRGEIETLLQDVCRTGRDRAVVALLGDTGMRVAALCSLRVGDVEFRDGGGGLYRPNRKATGLKNDDAKKPLTWSAAHVESYIANEHPRPDDDDAPLIHKTEGWVGDDDDGSMTPARIRQRLSNLVKNSDVDLEPEDVHPHTFRHTAVTIWAKQGFSDRAIKHRAGWSRDSDMLDRYEHIEEQEINQQILQQYGFDVENDEIGEPELDRCPRCSAAIQGVENYCPRCSAKLSAADDAQVLAKYVPDCVEELSERRIEPMFEMSDAERRFLSTFEGMDVDEAREKIRQMDDEERKEIVGGGLPFIEDPDDEDVAVLQKYGIDLPPDV